MTIPIPTIDDFDTSTVMTTIREVVDYLIGMVPQINNGDITDLQTSYTNNTLTITLVKGDGTTISKNVTIQGGSGTESPYPTDVALSLSGTTLNFNMAMSNGSPITGSVNLGTFATDAEVQGIQSDLQEQITGLKLSTSNNNMTLNGDSVQIVKSVSGTVSDGNLKITVNGVQSGDIPLPDIGGNKITFSKVVTPTGIKSPSEYISSFDLPVSSIKTRLNFPFSNLFYYETNNGAGYIDLSGGGERYRFSEGTEPYTTISNEIKQYMSNFGDGTYNIYLVTKIESTRNKFIAYPITPLEVIKSGRNFTIPDTIYLCVYGSLNITNVNYDICYEKIA